MDYVENLPLVTEAVLQKLYKNTEDYLGEQTNMNNIYDGNYLPGLTDPMLRKIQANLQGIQGPNPFGAAEHRPFNGNEYNPPVIKAISTKIDRHEKICKDLNNLYKSKNKDYGDSFGITFKEEGLAMSRIRLSDKLERFKKLSKNPEEQCVKNEAIEDTLMDLANYAIMTLIELKIVTLEGGK